MQNGKAMDRGIIGTGVRPNVVAMRERLAEQDYLAKLIAFLPEGLSAEVVDYMIDGMPIEEGNGALTKARSDSRIRIVELTVTKGGYFLGLVTGGHDEAREDIVHDAANANKLRTAFGVIVAALKARREVGHGCAAERVTLGWLSGQVTRFGTI